MSKQIVLSIFITLAFIPMLKSEAQPLGVPETSKQRDAHGPIMRGKLLKIENTFYIVSVDGSEGSFTVKSKKTGKSFLTSGKLGCADGSAQVVKVVDKNFGIGSGIEVQSSNGNRDRIAVFPDMPFVLFCSTLHNGGAEPIVVNSVPTISAVVDLNKPATSLKTLGTGGLLAPATKPGSYAFLAIADPETRNGVVGGWITHERGSGVVFSDDQGDAVGIRAQLDYGRLRLEPGSDAGTETFAFGYFDDARLGLEAYADAVAKHYQVKLPPHPAGLCTWYMEKFAGACDEQHVAELASYAAENLKPFGFDFVQIDDGWQEGIGGNGPCKNFTTHRPSGNYPSGMKAIADKISNLGLTPGIWFMPFAGTASDPYFKDHQDWFATGTNGLPYETRWGGTCLDMTHPGARDHLSGIVDNIAHKWGYRFFKMDGFWTGSATPLTYVNDGYRPDSIGDATFANPDKTNIEALREGTKLIRKTAGPNVFLLGCCVSQNMRSFGGSFGLLDAMRVGPDTGAGNIGAVHASRLWFLNGRVWWNDPDCVSVREARPLEQARLNASFTAIADDLFYNSDWLPDLSPERLDILRRCMPAHGAVARPVDVFDNQPARVWHVSDMHNTNRRDVVALYNWDKRRATMSCPLKRIGLAPAKEYVGFDFWAGKFLAPFKDELRADLPPGGSCRIMAIRPIADHPQVISTSRHVTQGMIDLLEEKWNAPALEGVSRLVGADPYELRVVVPTGKNSWSLQAVKVSSEDETAGVRAEFRQDGPRIRVTLRGSANRDVRWKMLFAPSSIRADVPMQPRNLKAKDDGQELTVTWDETGAEAYRVTQGDGMTATIPTAAYRSSDFQRGVTTKYSVQAIGWDGSLSTASSIEVTPEKFIAPPLPPLPDIYFDTLPIKEKSTLPGKLGINKSVSDKPLTVGGQTYKKGLGVYAPSLLVYEIPRNAKRFVAGAGLAVIDKRASVVFEIYGDVKEMGETPVLLGRSPVLSPKTITSWSFDLPLDARYREIRLVVTDAGDGNAGDEANWVNAGFMMN